MIKRIPLLILLLVLFLSVNGCSRNELARIPIQKTGQFETEFTHPGGELDFWTDFDVEFSGGASASYKIELVQGRVIVKTLSCNPFEVEESLMSRNVEANGLQKMSFLALMDCVVVLPEGDYIAAVGFSADGEDLKIFRADLILRQPDN